MVVHLGVPVKSALRIQDFPYGKVGGDPLWLFPETVGPQCCGRPPKFLLQLYVALAEVPHAFHRYLYVFLCQTCRRPVVTRQQLPEENALYSSKPPAFEETDEPDTDDLLAMLEGTKAPVHKELGLDIVEESAEITEGVEALFSLNLSDKQAVSLFDDDFLSGLVEQHEDEEDFEDSDDEDLDEVIGKYHRIERDYSFELLSKATRYVPKQVLRYSLGGTPLWYSDLNRPVLSVPPCEGCNSERVYEFQVMPQVLNVVESLADFGSVYVFSCPQSCSEGGFEAAVVQESL
jgi:pre-rRNA-processing protein TSR4